MSSDPRILLLYYRWHYVAHRRFALSDVSYLCITYLSFVFSSGVGFGLLFLVAIGQYKIRRFLTLPGPV